MDSGRSCPSRAEAETSNARAAGGIYRRRPWLAAWLLFESSVDLVFIFQVIPDFYFRLPFLTETTLDSKCVDDLRQRMSMDMSSINLTAEVRNLNSPACQKSNSVFLCTSTDELFASLGTSTPNYNNILFGVVLLACGIVAPMAEMVGRLLLNMSRLALVERMCPKLVCIYEEVFESLHSFLQHLTQFKLFLCFLELLMCIDLFSVNVMNMTGGPGVHRFVLFTMWSIFLTTIVAKIERNGGASNLLPPERWFSRQLGTYSGGPRGTIAIKNIFMLCCFCIFMTRSPFILVFVYNKSKTTNPSDAMHGVQHATFYDKSYGPISRGFERMWSNDFKTMWCVITFQVLSCNVILPLVQLAHVLLQEGNRAWLSIQLGWDPRTRLGKSKSYLGVTDNVELEQVLDDKVAPIAEDEGSRSEGEEEEHESSSSEDEEQQEDEDANAYENEDVRHKRRQITGARDVIEIVCFLCTENQAHEFFLLGMAMLLNVVEGMVTAEGLGNGGTSSISVNICFNPLVLACFLCGVVFLGRPRKLLHLAMEAEREHSFLSSMKQRIRDKCPIAPENWFVIRQVLLVWVFAYFLAFRGPVKNYFGRWTLNDNFVNGTFHCNVEEGYSTNCFTGELIGSASQTSQQGQLAAALSSVAFGGSWSATVNMFR